MPLFFVMLMYAIWASTFPINKLALQNAPPVFLAGMQMFLGGIIILGFLFIKNRKSLKIGKKQIIPLAVLSIFSIYLASILENWSMQYLSSAKVCFIYELSPFLVMICSCIHFSEKITKKKIIGIIIGMMGFIPIFTIQSDITNPFSNFGFFSLADLGMLGAIFFYVYGWIFLQVIIKKQSLSPLYANGYSMLFGGVMALVHSFFIDSWQPLPMASDKYFTVFMQVACIAIISNIICYNWCGFMLRRFSATFLSFCELFTCIFVSVPSWFLLHEKPSLIIFVSTGVVFFGLFITYQGEIRQKSIINSACAIKN